MPCVDDSIFSSVLYQFYRTCGIGLLCVNLLLYHHHHHIALVARISLTLSRHSSLSFIALGRSSGQHPVSSHSCWMYVRAGRPAFARPCVGIHKSTSLMSSSLLLQHIYIYIYMCVCVCVCLCVCVCVCVIKWIGPRVNLLFYILFFITLFYTSFLLYSHLQEANEGDFKSGNMSRAKIWKMKWEIRNLLVDLSIM